MRPIPTKVTGDQAFADEYTAMSQEPINFVTNSSQNLNAIDNQQMSRGACNYVSQGDYYSTTGSVSNTYIGIPPSPMLGISNSSNTYLDGQRFRINISVTNTGASTLNIQSSDTTFGAVSIKKGVTFGDLEGGELLAGITCEVVYVQSQAAFLLVHNGVINYIPSVSGGIQFLATVTSPQMWAVNSGFSVIKFDNLTQSIDNFYNPATFEATIPHTGIYSLNYALVVVYQPDPGVNLTIEFAQNITQLAINSVPIISANATQDQIIQIAAGSSYGTAPNEFSSNLILNKGDVITIEANIISTVSGGNYNVTTSTPYTFFNMSFIQPITL